MTTLAWPCGWKLSNHAHASVGMPPGAGDGHPSLRDDRTAEFVMPPDLTSNAGWRRRALMSVRFIVGRAGSGKTVHCLNAVGEALRAAPLDGPRLILLVPEQISLQMERSLLADLTAAAAHRAEVLSFRRLAHRVLSTCGDGGRTAVSDAARAMMLQLILARRGADLGYYRRAERFSGFVDRLGATITELITEGVGPDDLPESVEGSDDPARSLKLEDLRIIYRAYLDALGETKLDPSQRLDIARERLAQCPWAHGAHVWADGFAGFSGQERRLLGELASRAERLEISVLADPDAPPTTAVEHGAVWDLFAKTRRTMVELSAELSENGVAIEPPLVLRGPPRRFANTPALATVESRLFENPPTAGCTTEGVRVVGLPDRRTEVEYTVSQIQALVRRATSPLRYRDIAVIVRDLEPYHALLSAALNARGIPYFIDRRRPIAHHPLVELLRGLPAVASGDYPVETVRLLLKTDLLGIDTDHADALENYLVATATAGRTRWTQGDWAVAAGNRDEPTASETASMERVNVARRSLVHGVDPWVVGAGEDERASGSVWSERISATMRHLSAAERIERWADDADGDGDLDLAEAHRQILRDVDALLDDLAVTIGDERIGLEELASMLDAGLSRLTLGLAPPMLDQVLVGSIERSRQPDIRVALVLGANDGAFPAIPAEDSILNDDDRVWLEGCGLRLGTPRRQRVMEEALLFYIAVTRARDALVVTYPESADDGKELRPSPYLAAMQGALGGLEIEHVTEPFAARADWSVLTHRDLTAQMAFELRHRPERLVDDAATRTLWNDLYETVRTDEELARTLRPALQSLVYENRATLGTGTTGGGSSEPFRASVSRLETFATCPFKHFARYGLNLTERRQASLEATDIGTIHHAILERFVVTLLDRGQSPADLDDAALIEGLRDSCRYVGDALPAEGMLSQARDRYLMDRSDKLLGGVVRTQRSVTKAGAFRPKAAELKFGLEGAALKGLEITTPKGRRAILRGVIDRVDLAEVSDEMLGVVIDYKRTLDKRLDLSQVYHGLSLQLLAYLLVLEQSGTTLSGRPIKPAGAFYMSLLSKYKSVAHPSEAGEDTATQSAHRPRGVFDAARLDALEKDCPAGGRASVYAAYRKKDGGFGHVDSTDTAESEDFTLLLRHTRRRLSEWIDRILDGDIEVAPYRLGTLSPCGWCAYRTVCRFEPASTGVRYLETMKRSAVFENLRDEGSEVGV